jgi:hypothetical protein
MNAIRISSLIRFAGLALLAACFVAGHANAQVFQGKFTLPFQARWGQAILPAGDYSFTLGGEDPRSTLRVCHGQKIVGMIRARSYDYTNSGRAELTVQEGAVSTLRLPELGIILRYAPQRPKHLRAPEERQLAQAAPVTAVGK